MSEAWYFDAIDARAGRGFVTWRAADLDRAEWLADGCYFVGPPDFEPDHVASRAIALSAARGSFDLGLLDGEGEIPFPTLAAAADFVRRGYLRGSGSDGAPAGPGGGPPPEPSPPTEPVPPFEPDGGWLSAELAGMPAKRDPARRLARELGAFRERSEAAGRGEAREMRWLASDVEARESGAKVLAVRLATAGLRIAVEQIRRCAPDAGPAPAARAANNLARLGRVLVRAGLAMQVVSLGRRVGGLDHWLDGEFTRLGAAGDSRPRGSALLIPWLLMGGDAAGVEQAYGFGLAFESPLYPDLHFLEPVDPDPVELLAQLWLPEPFATALPEHRRAPDQATLFHFAFSALASPATILSDGDAHAAIDLLLFAALCITQPAIERGQPPAGFANNVELRRNAACDAALRWVVDALPRHAFAATVEDLIAAPPVRYAGRAATATA